MADQKKGGGITWTEVTWNPIRGCSRVSAGCKNCYAERTAGRFSGEGQPYHGLAVVRDGESTWTGEVAFIEKHLMDPLRWERPRLVFVNSMSDLFHEKLSLEKHIAPIFAVMAMSPQHTFQVLTKRAERMREVLAGDEIKSLVKDWVDILLNEPTRSDNRAGMEIRWPLPNVWAGVSIEDQSTADARLHELYATPAAVRWASAEPLLGEIILPPVFPVDWLVVGGESQSGARHMDLSWARRLVEQCGMRDTRVFVKQLGGYPDARKVMAKFPPDLQVQEYPEARS